MRIQMRYLTLFGCICLCFIMLGRVSVARSYQDYQTWNLPDGAFARFGKGGISQGDRVIAFSPDGGLLAVATTIGVWLYDVKTTRELAFFTGESRWNHAVAFSPDGTRLAAGVGSRVKLWDIATRTNYLTLEGPMGGFWSVAFSPDGTKIAAGGGGTVDLWEAKTGKKLDTLKGHSDWVRSIMFSPDGTLLASGSSDMTVKLWEVSSGTNTITLTGHTDRVRSISFSPDGTRLATGSADKSVKLWDVKTGANIDTLGSTKNPLSAKQVLRSILRGTRSGPHAYGVDSVAFSPDGTLLASGSSGGTVKLWEVKTGQNITTLQEPVELDKSVAFSPDSKILALASESLGTVTLREISTGETEDIIYRTYAKCLLRGVCSRWCKTRRGKCK